MQPRYQSMIEEEPDEMFTRDPSQYPPELNAPPPTMPVFNPQAGAPPPVVPPPAAHQVPPQAPPNELQDFLTQQRAGMQKYGPEQQMAVEQEIAKRRGSFGNIAGNAMTGFADALMQGVARAGPSNFQGNLQNRNDKTEANMRGAMQNAQASKTAQMKQEMELVQIDPESPLSRLAQRTHSPTLKGMGLTDEEIREMPAALIGEATTKRLSLEEIRAKAEEAKALHELTAGVQGRSLAQIREHQAAEEKTAREKVAAESKAAKEKLSLEKRNTAVKTQQDASKTLEGMDTFVGGVKKATASWPVVGNPGLKLLKKQAAGETQDATDFATEAEAEAAMLPAGTIVRINGRRAKIK